jgi:NAD(P)-dependent dehydrogenase (short-subunit alcohol dehydrogenase family)
MSQLFDLSGKVAVVTGSTKGIGRAIAVALAEHGAKIVVSSRDASRVAESAAALRDAGHEVTGIACNIGRKGELQALVDGARTAYGAIDVVVCNAAINPHYGPSMEIPDEIFAKVMGSNIQSNLWLAQMVVPEMRARRDGVIVIVSSIGGLRGSDVIGAYNVSKAADMQLARNLACEYGPHNVRVNCIAPGLIKTDFAKALWDNPENLKASTSRSPLLRIGIPDEIAGAAVFLGSAAGNFMTGQTMVIDGGATIS